VTDREFRLRQRIDDLSDLAETLREEVSRARRHAKRWKDRCRRAHKSAAHWREMYGANTLVPGLRTKGLCSGCQCRYDERTKGCRRCTERHSKRQAKTLTIRLEDRPQSSDLTRGLISTDGNDRPQLGAGTIFEAGKKRRSR